MLQLLKLIRKSQKTVTPHEENTNVRLRIFKRLLKAPIVIYAGFESILKPANDNKNDNLNTKYIKIIMFGVMFTI